jgi:hypothetical protein
MSGFDQHGAGTHISGIVVAFSDTDTSELQFREDFRGKYLGLGLLLWLFWIVALDIQLRFLRTI